MSSNCRGPLTRFALIMEYAVADFFAVDNLDPQDLEFSDGSPGTSDVEKVSLTLDAFLLHAQLYILGFRWI